MIGHSIAHFKVTAKLGAGGMGEVYRATDTKLGRDVALKLLPHESFSDKEARARLVNEARSAAVLNHPHICTVFEVGEAEGQTYIAMELVEGQSLSARLAEGPLPAQQVLRYGQQLAEALAHAHDRGLVHRDLKSANIILTPEGRSKVLDFGLAKRVSGQEMDEATRSQLSLTRPGTLTGTLAYMAPEQLRGQAADARSDIWALGIVLYEMAAGTRPFQGESGFDLSSAIVHQAPPRLPAGVPIELRAVIDRCLEKEPGRRYQRAGEVRAALEAVQTGAVVPAEVWRYRMRRVRSWWWLAGAGVASAALGAVLLWPWLARFAEPTPTWTVKPLTSLLGMEWGATWSPDGNMIAYAHNRYGHMDIFVMPAGGGDPVRLTDNPADELVARWSPDGRYIAFTSDRGEGTSVYLIPPLGGAERKLVDTHLAWFGREVEALSTLGAHPWSPDASQLVF